ncbi:hypothetical protein ACOSQ4_024155 [Xanthoceras sorbifolium]
MRDEMWFSLVQTSIKFGKLEFCLVSGLRFRPLLQHVVTNFQEVTEGILHRYSHGGVPQRLDAGDFGHVDNAIKLLFGEPETKQRSLSKVGLYGKVKLIA